MIDKAVDRFYRPIRISNRMRLAKLLLLLLRLWKEAVTTSASISGRVYTLPLLRHGNKSNVSAPRRQPYSVSTTSKSRSIRRLQISATSAALLLFTVTVYNLISYLQEQKTTTAIIITASSIKHE